MVVVVTVVKISVHSSMCSDGDDICDATFVMKVAMFKLCLFISLYCNVFSYCDYNNHPLPAFLNLRWL